MPWFDSINDKGNDKGKRKSRARREGERAAPAEQNVFKGDRQNLAYIAAMYRFLCVRQPSLGATQG